MAACRAPAARFSKARQNRKISNVLDIPDLQSSAKKVPSEVTPNLAEKFSSEKSSSAQKVKKKVKKEVNFQKWSKIFDSEKNRQTEVPQFHLQSLCDSRNHNIVILRFGVINFKIDLVTLRIFLCLVNLVPLLSALVSFQAWIWIEDIKLETTQGLSRAEKDQDPFHVPHQWLHEQNNVLGMVL